MVVNSKDFQGVFYPSSPRGTAMIVVTGSDGGIKWAKSIAKAFSKQGIPALAVAYWKTKDTPKTLSLVPIEIIRSAVLWLKNNGFSKVGIYGMSKGAELALVAASLIPQLELVIAVSPACCVFEGIAKPHYSGASSWTWNGAPLPYASFADRSVSAWKNIIRNREYGYCTQYLQVLVSNKREENTIKVEHINGPILLLSAKHDAQWPASQMGNMICERLKEKRFAFPFRHESFAPASHLLSPISTPVRFAYRQERKQAKACDKARGDAWSLSVEWAQSL